ncbi:MAG: ABC transporter ATP-binding protein [Bacteriovoracaceae bacterium]|nr:ABC transporter ATP-binding protein [Bacteriovoracaceae bacterium]
MNIQEKFIDKYYGQSTRLPEELKKMLGKKEVELYGMADLNEEFKFANTWVVLAEDNLIAFKDDNGKLIKLCEFEVSKISRVKEKVSQSATIYEFLTADDLPPLLTVVFSGRQKIIMGHLKYLVEMKMEGIEHNKPDEWNPDEEYQKAILKPLLDAQNGLTDKKAKTLVRLLSYLLPYKKQVIIGTFGAIAATAVALIPAYLSGYLIDHVVKPFQKGGLDQDRAMMMAWILIGGLFATYVAREFFAWIRLNKMSILGEFVALDIREELYTHLQTLGLDFYSRKQTGSIISRVSSDTDRIWDFVAFGVVEVGIALFSIVGLSSVLISLDWRLGLLMAVPVPLLLLSIYLHGEKMQKLFIKAWRKWSDLTSVLADTVPGIQVVKAFNQEKKEIKRFNKTNKVVTDEFNNIHQAWTRFWPLLMLGIHLVLLSVWIFAIPRLMSHEGEVGHLTAGTFVSFLLYMTMFSQPIEVIGQMARMLNRALSSAYRIFEILDTKASITSGDKVIKDEDLKGDVEFKDVTFSYDGVRSILKGVNFNVKQGEMIGLVGSSGGGKSTITKLIARFYDVTSGSVLVDGHDLRTLQAGAFRKKVGMVLQDPYLFHGTIFENICYGLPEADMRKVIESAKVANAHDFITRLPQGYETVVGERGHTLSGGERQRVSIARAILHDPKILILDEATSAVDTETERKIQDALDKLIEGRTVFAVAHRLSTLRKADRIFVIDKGQIAEEGTHAELLAMKEGKYANLHRMQQEMSESFVL